MILLKFYCKAAAEQARLQLGEFSGVFKWSAECEDGPYFL